MNSQEYTEYSLLFKENFSWNPIELRLETIFLYLKEKMTHSYFKTKDYVNIEKIYSDLIPNDGIFFAYNQINIQNCIRDIAFLNPSKFCLSKDENFIKKIK
jgi:hypothetical protein